MDISKKLIQNFDKSYKIGFKNLITHTGIQYLFIVCDFIAADSGSGIHISNADQDPGWPSCGSSMRIRIRNTGFEAYRTSFSNQMEGRE